MSINRIQTTASLHGLEELKTINQRTQLLYEWYRTIVNPLINKYDMELDRGVSGPSHQYFTRQNAPEGLEQTLMTDIKHTLNVQFRDNPPNPMYDAFAVSTRAKVLGLGSVYFVVKRVKRNSLVSLSIQG